MQADRDARERQLAGTLIQIGIERGAEIEAIVEELSEQPLPSFVDTQVFRASLIEAAEEQLKAQLNERIHSLKQRVGISEELQGRLNQPGQASDTPSESDDEPETIVVDDEPPDDATTIWNPREE